MKAIMISIKPKWVAKILNGDKTIEVRKGTALYKATQKLIDEYGYAEFLVYCTKDGELFYDPITKKWLSLKSRNIKKVHRLSNGAVKFKFRCYKVEEIFVGEENNDYFYKTKRLANIELRHTSCLSNKELLDYLNLEQGTAIHISDLEIFDRPKELSEFYKVGHYEDLDDYFTDEKQINGKWCIPLKKAPQSMCYIEVEEEQ